MTDINLFLHVGPHKTGSTTIQHLFRKNEARLSGLDFVYLKNTNILTRLETIQSPKKNHSPALRDWICEKTEQRPARNYLISSEKLCGSDKHAYLNSELVAETLADAFSDFSCHIVCFLRRQDSFVESLYTQSIHEGGTLEFDEYCSTYPIEKFDWFRLLNSFSDVFGKSSVLARRYGPDLIPDFCDALGIPEFAAEISDQITNQNRGYSRPVLELARMANQHLDRPQSQALRRLLQKVDPKEPLASYRFFSDEERYRFLSNFSESNALVAEQYLGDDSGALFSPPQYNGYTDTDYHLQPDKAVSILAAALADLALTSELKSK